MPLFNSSCAQAGCHDNGTKQSGIDMSSYQSIKSTISGNLLMQVIQDPGPLGMPPDPGNKLNSTQIQLIQTWINQGMKDGIDCNGPCDSSNVTFSGTINSLLQNSCVGCHSGSSGTNLVGYANVKAQVDNGKLFCAVNHESGCLPMPQNAAKLSNCKIRQIKIWIDAGAPNN